MTSPTTIYQAGLNPSPPDFSHSLSTFLLESASNTPRRGAHHLSNEVRGHERKCRFGLSPTQASPTVRSSGLRAQPTPSLALSPARKPSTKARRFPP